MDIELPRLAVVIGPNAVGKSNLLDALQAMSRLATERTLADALAEPIRGFSIEAFTLPPGGLAQLLQQERAQFSLEADLLLEPSPRPERVRYRLGVAIDPDAGALQMADEYLSRMTQQWQPRELARIERQDHELLIRRKSQPGRTSHEPLYANHTKLADERDALREWRTYYMDVSARRCERPCPRARWTTSASSASTSRRS